MTTIREEIDRRLASNQVYYAHFVTDEMFKPIRDDTTNDILKLIEKRIDEKANNFLNVFDVNVDELDLLQGRPINECPSEVAYLKALVDTKRMLK